MTDDRLKEIEKRVQEFGFWDYGGVIRDAFQDYIPELLAEVRRLRATLRELKEQP